MERRPFFVSIVIAVLLIVSGALAFALMASPGEVSSSNARASATATAVTAQVSPSSSSSPTPASNAASSGNLVSSASTLSATSPSSYISAAQAAHVPLKYVYVPAAPSKPHFQGGYYSPGYLQSPAPIGIGAYGIRNSSGTLVPYSYTSNGFAATINASTLTPFDVNSYDPSGMTMQLNTILTDATVMGVTGYTYWTQNVILYDSYSHQFQMVDNIWNFSSPTAGMPAGTIFSHTAVEQPYSAAYIGFGPAINNFSAPFVATLTLESTVIGGYDTVFFNYTVNYTNSSSLARQSIGGVFDEVMFNSPSGVLGYTPPMPVFRVDGGNITPTGFIPYDAEIILGGPGGGSHINLAAINATMQLTYMDSSGNYVNVPSAYDIGSETGETASGAAVAWQQSGVTTFTSGPSFVEGMWNVSSYTGMTHYTGVIAPSNAFMFVSPGSSIDPGQYGYVPMTASGEYSFWLPTGTYYQEVLMSYHTAEAGSLSASESITLTSNSATGVYTPLYAIDNAQVANISMSGSGTVTSPYLLFNNQTGYLNGLFGNFNDYGFPLFSGMMIANTNVYVDSNNTPSFEIMYNGLQVMFYMAFYEVPSVDYLGIVLYNTSNLSIYNANMITGTMIADYEAGFYGANLMMWNSTNDLVANSTFVPAPYYQNAISLLIYDPANVFSNNTIYGNYFLAGAGGFLFPGDLAIGMDSSGNLVFNNYLDNAFNVFDKFGDLYTGAPTLYLNTYNITSTPTSAFSMSVNGYTLMGNILGNDTMGGNYWNDYLPGISTLPFNDFGDIALGGDYLPIVLQPALYFPVVFEQTGLLAGHAWSVTMGGVTKTTTGSMIVFEALIGNYTYTITTSGNYLSNRPTGGVAVINTSTGIAQDIGIFFLPYTLVTVNEVGLPAGYGWGADTVTNGGFTTTSSLTFAAVQGMWALSYYLDGSIYYYFPNNYSFAGGSGLVVIGSTPETFDVFFVPLLNPFTLYAYGAGPTDTWSYTAWMVLNDGSQVNMGTFQGTGPSTTALLPFADYYFTFSSNDLASTDGPGPFGIVEFGPPGYHSQSSMGIPVTSGSALTFTLANLPAGVTWQVSAYASNYYWYGANSTTGSSITLVVPHDTIYYQVSFTGTEYAGQSGTIFVNGPTTVNVPLMLSPSAQVTVTFAETGLSSGTSWQVTFNGQTQSSTSSSISFTTNPGQEYYQVYSNGSMSPQSSGSLNIQGSMTVDVQFYALPAPTYTITFVAAGLPSTQSWSVTFNGQTKTTSNGAAVFTAPAGSYSYSVANVSGYTLTSNASTLSVGSNTILLLQFQAVKGTTPTTPSSTPNYLMYAGLLAIGLVVGGLVGFALLRYTGRKRKQ